MQTTTTPFSLLVPSIKRIGILDSGLGGLTVLSALIQKFPADYIYLADTINLPYGQKTAKELCTISVKNIAFLLTHDVDCIVIACNTISSVAFETLKKQYPTVLFINMLDVMIPSALQTTQNGIIGVLATRATIASNKYKNTIENKGITKRVIQEACPELASAIEEHPQNQIRIDQLITQHLQHLINEHVDTIILGCTHYELIAPLIAQKLPAAIKLVSIMQIVQKQINYTVQPHSLPIASTLTYFVTGDCILFAEKLFTLFNLPEPRLLQSAKI